MSLFLQLTLSSLEGLARERASILLSSLSRSTKMCLSGRPLREGEGRGLCILRGGERLRLLGGRGLRLLGGVGLRLLSIGRLGGEGLRLLGNMLCLRASGGVWRLWGEGLRLLMGTVMTRLLLGLLCLGRW